ncbi:MAG: hypothetical protein AAF992_16390 [Bacteroidota bacterium]
MPEQVRQGVGNGIEGGKYTGPRVGREWVLPTLFALPLGGDLNVQIDIVSNKVSLYLLHSEGFVPQRETAQMLSSQYQP